MLRGGPKVEVLACEPAACPSLTRGRFAYDFGDTGHLTPLVKMHTLGSEFIPPGFHAGGLRYHGMAPMVSHLLDLRPDRGGRLRPARVLRGRRRLRAGRGHPAGARGDPRGQGRDRPGAQVQGGRREQGDPVQPLRPRPFRHAGLRRLLRGHAHRPELRRGRPRRPRSRTCRRSRRNSALAAAGAAGTRSAPAARGAWSAAAEPARTHHHRSRSDPAGPQRHCNRQYIGDRCRA